MWGLYAPRHNLTEADFHTRARDRIDEMALFHTRRLRDLVGFTGLRVWRVG